MPSALLRPCAQPGCPNRVPSGRCSEHARQADTRRGTATERGYTYRWHQESRAHLRRFPLCGDRRPDALSQRQTECQKVGRETAANVVDHLIPHRGDQALFWNRRNWGSSCKRCHDLKTATEDGGFGR